MPTSDVKPYWHLLYGFDLILALKGAQEMKMLVCVSVRPSGTLCCKAFKNPKEPPKCLPKVAQAL